MNDSIGWRAQHVWFGELNNGKTIINMDFINEFGELRESIRISDFDLSIGTKILLPSWGVWTPDFEEPSAYFDTFQADGDATTESYDLYQKDNFENYLKINSISADGLEIEGEYQLYFVISPLSPSKFNKNRPDPLIYTDGFFKARKLEWLELIFN